MPQITEIKTGLNGLITTEYSDGSVKTEYTLKADAVSGAITDPTSLVAIRAASLVEVGSFALVGDSRNDQQSSSGGKNRPALNWYNRWNAMAAQPAKMIGKFAMSGTQTSALAGQVALILELPYRPQFTVILSGVNNYGTTTAATAAADISAACQMLLAAGITPIVFNETGATAFTGAPAIAWLFELRDRLSSMAYDDRRIWLFDPAQTLWDSTGAAWTTTPAPVFKAGYLGDGTHTTNLGAYQLALAFNTWVGSRIPAFDLRCAAIGEAVNANNPLSLIANGLFTTTTGGATAGAGVIASGTVPASWTYNRGTRADTSTSITYVAGAYGNDLTLAVTTTGADTVKLIQDLPGGIRGALAVGNVLQCGYEVEASAGTNLQGIQAVHEYNDGTTTSTYYDLYAGAQAANPPGNGPQAFGPDVLQPPVIVLPSLPTGWCTTRLEAVFSGAGGATIKVRRARFKKRPT
jgi:hypothetical protein